MSDAPTLSGFDLVDFDQLYDARMRYPFRGVRYPVDDIGIRTGALLTLAIEGDPGAEARIEEHPDTLARMVLGSAYDLMLADDVPEAFIDRCVAAHVARWRHGPVEGLRVWAVGHDPKVLDILFEIQRQVDLIP